jgi:uncharacterized protein (DUF433 family)
MKESTNMATLDWSQCPAVESIPGKRSGAWVFRDTRTPVSVVFDNLEVGASINEIMDWFHLSHEQVVAVIEFAARSLDAPLVTPPPAQVVDAHPLR